MSFILRQVHTDGLLQNFSIGKRYIVHHRENNPKEFKEALGATVTHPDQDQVFAILFYTDGDNQEMYPLYEKQHYYIMTESGQTFERIKP